MAEGPTRTDIGLTDQPARRSSPLWLTRLELALGASAAIWLQVVGQVTNQVMHHVLHALPIVVLLLVPRNRWVHLTCALTGFLWIFMLAVITDMVHHALLEGGLLHGVGLFVWLAPVQAALGGAWMAANLAVLSRHPRRLLGFMLGALALIPILAALHPHAEPLFAVPVMEVARGHWLWAGVLALQLPAVLVVPGFLAMWFTGFAAYHPTRSAIGWMAAYWLFFLSCMVLGLLPALNP
jgi:hypothetical protein